MNNPLIIAILPAVVIGYLSGLYWSKRGYRRTQYTILGMFAAYALIVRIVMLLLDN